MSACQCTHGQHDEALNFAGVARTKHFLESVEKFYWIFWDWPMLFIFNFSIMWFMSFASVGA